MEKKERKKLMEISLNEDFSLDDVDFITINITFREKANCKRMIDSFTDKEGVTYITGYKQEGSSHNSGDEEE